MKVKEVQARIFTAKCYNFALGFVNDWQLQRQHEKFNPDLSIKLSAELSSKIKKTVKEFLVKQQKATTVGPLAKRK